MITSDKQELEQNTRAEERMLVAIADIFENRGQLSINTLEKMQNSDHFCSRIMKLLHKGRDQPSYLLIKNILVKTEYDKERKNNLIKIVLPEDILPLVCREIHYKNTIHTPLTGCIAKFKKLFYNRNIKAYMQRTIDNCIICKYTEVPTGKAAPGPGQDRTLDITKLKPREAIALDLAIGLPPNQNGFKNALTVVCLKSNFGQVYALKSKMANEVCKRLEDGWIKHYHAPSYIYADLGSEFAGDMNNLCLKYGIKHYSTFPQSQQGNRSELLVKEF